MPKIKYHYAYDEEGNIVDIYNVSPEIRRMHSFHCLSCKAAMVAKLGDKNAHHFAHKKENGSCSTETYLHKLGKVLLKKRFEESPTFIVELHRDVECSKRSKCPFYNKEECRDGFYRNFDLKDYYDTCKEEQQVGNFVADLLLSSSKYPNRKPVIVEICVTHASTQEKINSGLKIIEFKIKSEEDLKKIVSTDIFTEYTYEEIPESEIEWAESHNMILFGGGTKENVDFYGFESTSEADTQLDIRALSRFILFSSGSAIVRTVSCIEGSQTPRSILELDIDACVNTSKLYECGLVMARNLGFNVKNCLLCGYKRKNIYKEKWDDSRWLAEHLHAHYGKRFNPDMFKSDIYCSLHKTCGTPLYPKQKEANSCPHFILDANLVMEANRELPIMIISRIK